MALLLVLAAGAASAQITFRAAASSNATTGNLTIAKPTGTAENDVMIAAIGVRPDTVTITPPSGWTLVRRIDNTASNANSLAVYRKTAGASEAANYTWTLGASPTGSAGGIQTFSGVDLTTPIDIENGQTTADALTHATPDVTTTVANTMLVTSHTFSSSATWTPPGGMTEGVDDTGGLQATEGAYVLQASAGATGAKTATASADADVGIGHILALRPATAVLTGTLSDGAGEAAIVAGGETLVITLTGDTWDATIGADNAKTTALIAGIDSAQAEATGWDAVVKANLDFNDVVRTSATVVTITLGAEATYDITASETVTVTVPATAVAGTGAIVATPTFNITQATAALTGTLGDGATESAIVAGGETLIITLTGDTWDATIGADNAKTTALIAGIDSAQAEAAGWDAVAKANMDFNDVTRTSATVVTITLGAEATYDITASETVTVTVPATAVAGSEAIVATPTFAITATTAALTGTLGDGAGEGAVATGGETLIITLSGDTWDATIGADNAKTTALIGGIDSAQSETNGWDAVVRANMDFNDVSRTSDTVVTITLGAEATYAITASETITVTVPATAVAGPGAIVATPTFAITPSSAALTGTLGDGAGQAEMVAGGETLIITLTGDTWDATIGADNAKTTALIAGIDSAQSETNGWDAVVRANLDFNDVVRTSTTVVTITFGAEATYAITASETVTITVPATAVAGANALVASPTFVVTPISFRAAASAGATTGNLTITKPAGTAQDDVMIASIGVRPETVGISPPTGWTLVRRIDNTASNANALAVYRKTAGAGEPADYTWTLTSPTGSAGGIQSFAGVDTITPIDVENGQTTARSVSHATPDVTTTVADVMLVTSHTFSSAETWTPPTGMTEAFDVSGGLQATEGNFVQQASAGATGVKTATAAAGADAGNTHILALTPDAGVAHAVLTGTLSDGAVEDTIVAGGETLIITLTNDTWDATVGADNAVTTALIAGLDSAQSETNGWDAVVKANLDFNDVVRTSATVVTITLGAEAAYAMTATETITVTVPATAVAGASPIVATSTFGITPFVVTFRAAASAGATTGNLTITKPAGTVQNDVMIASIGVRPDTTTITPPAGWTLVRRIDNSSINANTLAVYRKTAGGSEPANYTWTLSGQTASAGGIQTFFNVELTTPIDVENGQTTASALTHATPSVTTTVADAVLVASHTFASAATWTPPGGMTEGVDVGSGSTGTVESRVAASTDDAEEAVSGGAMDLTSSDLELVDEGGTPQQVGMRFLGITVPPGAAITNAYIEFETDELDSGATSVTLYAEDADNPGTFTSTAGDITNRTKTTASVAWNSIPAWGTESEKHQTPDLSAIIQEVVDRGGWVSGNAMVVIVTGSGERTAESYNGEAANAPLIHIEYGDGSGQSVEASYALQATAGVSGTKTATAATAADVGNTHLLALAPGTPAASYVGSGGVTGTSFSFDIGTAGTNRAVLVFAGHESTGTNLTGVTVDAKACNLVTRADNAEGSGNHQELWYCDEDDLGASNGTVTVAIAGGDASWGTHAHLYTAAGQNGPTDVGIDNTSVGLTTVTVTGIEVPQDGLVVMGAGQGTGALTVSSWTAPLVERQDGPDPTSADLFEASGIETVAQTNKTYVATFSATHDRGTGIVAVWPKAGAVAAAALTGTVSGGETEYGISTGGETLIITLTNDTWDATVGADNAVTDALIAGIDSAQSETNGWDAVVKANMDFNDVVRTSATVVTITLGTEATYDITTSETVTVTVPASALTGSGAIVATPTFAITSVAPFGFRKSITIDRTKVAVSGTTADTLSNYPLLYSVTDPDLKLAPTGDVESASGYDILFRATDDATCGGTGPCTLDHEIESYDSGSGALVAWVRVPSVNTNKLTTDTVIYIYYGNSAITTSFEDADGVWDTNYKGVWHLDESPANGEAGHEDSSGNNNTGTPSGFAGDANGTTNATGKVGGANRFDGTDDLVDTGSDATLDDLGPLTMSAWIQPDTNGEGGAGKIITKYDTGTGRWFLEIDDTTPEIDTFEFFKDFATTNQQRVTSNSTVSYAAWQHMVLTWDGTTTAANVHIYKDGVELTYQTTTDGAGAAVSDAAEPLVIGAKADNGNAFDGYIDEVRVSSVVRDADWVKTVYNNTNGPGDIGAANFYSVGSEDASPLTAVTLISFTATGYDRAVLLEWRTGYEIDNLGFHLYRDRGDDRVQLTTSLVAGSGLLAARGDGATVDRRYGWWDNAVTQATPGISYWLEDVDFDGTSTWHGPVTPVDGGHLIDTGPPAPGEGVRGVDSESLDGFGQQVGASRRRFLVDDPRATTSDAGLAATPRETQWDLAGQSAVKLGVQVDGWYRVSQSQLLAGGLDPDAHPRDLRLFVDGVEQAMVVTGAQDQQFDPNDAIEFYGVGVDTAYTDTRVYWLVEGDQPGLRVQVVDGQPILTDATPEPTPAAPPTPAPEPVVPPGPPGPPVAETPVGPSATTSPEPPPAPVSAPTLVAPPTAPRATAPVAPGSPGRSERPDPAVAQSDAEAAQAPSAGPIVTPIVADGAEVTPDSGVDTSPVPARPAASGPAATAFMPGAFSAVPSAASEPTGRATGDAGPGDVRPGTGHRDRQARDQRPEGSDRMARVLAGEIRLARAAGIPAPDIAALTGEFASGDSRARRRVVETLRRRRLTALGYDITMRADEYAWLQSMAKRVVRGVLADGDVQGLLERLAADPAYLDRLSRRGLAAPVTDDGDRHLDDFLPGLEAEHVEALSALIARLGRELKTPPAP